MEIFKQLSKKGYKHYYEGTIEELDSMDKYNQHLHSEIMQVIMWLYEKHGVWIRVTPIPYSENLTHWRWEHMSTNYTTRNVSWKKQKDYLSPTEAYEAAIKYCLEKII